MSTITKERRDAIRYWCGVGVSEAEILAILDALDAAEKAEPVAFIVRPMSTAPSGDDALDPSEIELHEGSWAIVVGTNDKPIGWIDTYATFEGRFYRDRPVVPLAAEKAEPALWITPGNLNAVKELDGQPTGVVVSMAADDDGTRIPLYERPAPAVREGWKPLPVGPLTDVLDAISDVIEQMDDAGFSHSAIDLVPLRNARMALVRALAAAPEAN